MDDSLQKFKKVVRIVLYGPAIGQSDYRKAGPYELPFNNYYLLTGCEVCTIKYKAHGLPYSPSFQMTQRVPSLFLKQGIPPFSPRLPISLT